MAEPQQVRAVNESMEKIADAKAEELTRQTDEQVKGYAAKMKPPESEPVPGARMIDESGAVIPTPAPQTAGAETPKVELKKSDYLAEAAKAAKDHYIPGAVAPGAAPAKAPAPAADVGEAIRLVTEGFRDANKPMIARLEQLERQRNSTDEDNIEPDKGADERRALKIEIDELKVGLVDSKKRHEDETTRLITAERHRFEQTERQQIRELATIVAGKFPQDSNKRPLVVSGQLKDAFYEWVEMHPEVADYERTPSLAALARERMPELAQEIFEPLAELAAQIAPSTTVVEAAVPAATETGSPTATPSPPPSVPSAPGAAPQAGTPEEETIDVGSPEGRTQYFDSFMKKYTGVAEAQERQRQ